MTYIYIYIYIYYCSKKGEKKKRKAEQNVIFCYFVRKKREMKENGVWVRLIENFSFNLTRDLRLILFDLIMNESLVFSSKKKKEIWGSKPC